MKFLTTIIIVLFNLSLCAQSYYVSPSGDDSFLGTSPQTAWKTLEKVNSFAFPQGSVLYLTGTLYGGISISSEDGLTLITKYGDTAVIQTTSNAQNAILIYNKGDIEVNGLRLNGTGNAVLKQEGNGVFFYSDDNKRHKNIAVKNCVIKNFSGSGITTNFIWVDYNQVRAYAGGYDGITFDRCRTDSNGYAGIATYGIWPKKNNTNVRITNCEAHYNKGIHGKTPHSGHGILAAGFVGGLIEYCKASWNGWQYSGGNIGIWVHDCDSAIIQYSESWRTKSNTTIDGGGFDLDGGTTNSVIQFCYSHENDGEGYLAWPYSYGDLPADMVNVMRNNTIRYNISVNDAQENPYGSLTVGGAIPQYDLYVYNNTFINPVKGGVITKIGNNIQGKFEIKNNIFVSKNRAYMWGDVKNNVFVTDTILVDTGNVIPDATNKRIPSITFDSKYYTNDPNVWNMGLELPFLPSSAFYGDPIVGTRDIGATELQLDNPLPIKLKYFKGVRRGREAHLSWETSLESDLSHYVIQTSTNGVIWKDLRTVAKAGVDFPYSEVVPLVPGANHFRLKAIDNDNTFEYSKSIRINYNIGPVNVRIFNTSGQLVRYYRQVLIFNPKLPVGVYIFQFEHTDGSVYTEKRFIAE